MTYESTSISNRTCLSSSWGHLCSNSKLIVTGPKTMSRFSGKSQTRKRLNLALKQLVLKNCRTGSALLRSIWLFLYKTRLTCSDLLVYFISCGSLRLGHFLYLRRWLRVVCIPDLPNAFSEYWTSIYPRSPQTDHLVAAVLATVL